MRRISACGSRSRLKDKGSSGNPFCKPIHLGLAARGRLKGIARAPSAHMLCLFPFEPELVSYGRCAGDLRGPSAGRRVFPLKFLTSAAARELLQINQRWAGFHPSCPAAGNPKCATWRISTSPRLRCCMNAIPMHAFLVPLTTRETRLLFEDALRRRHAHVDVPIRILFGHAVEAMTRRRCRAGGKWHGFAGGRAPQAADGHHLQDG